MHAVICIIVGRCLGEARNDLTCLVTHFNETLRGPAWELGQSMQLLLDKFLVRALSPLHCLDQPGDVPVDFHACDTVVQPLR
ncbi:hypothetical protein D3C76_1345110 [compost metagenome]